MREEQWVVMSARAKNERQRDVTALFAGRATLARSLRLLGEFRFEQSDPARFYGALPSTRT